MAITYPLAFPTTKAPRMVQLSPRTVVAYQKSPYTLQGQAQVHQGMQWQGQVQLPPMRRADMEVWLAWLMALNGPEGTFLMGPADIYPDYALLGSGAGSPSAVVDGASQTGRTLNIKGFASLAANVLKAGDYLGLGTSSTSRFYKVLQDITSDSAGKAAVPIWPRLRESPANNAAITLTTPKGVFRLADLGASWSMDPDRVVQSGGFSFEEAI